MQLMTIREAARALGVPEGRIRRAVREGALSCLELGNRRMVDLEEARALAADAGVGLKEMAERTGLSVHALRRGILAGWIPARKEGKAWRMDAQEAEKAIRARMARREPGRKADDDGRY